MGPVGLARVVLPVTALPYGILGLRTRRGWRWWRVVTGRRAAPVDPYHAAADRWLLGDDIQAAAARLLLDGLATVNHRGNLAVTAAGADPQADAGHRVPDALLAALRRRTAPVALGNLVSRDVEFATARAEFHAACGNRLRLRRPVMPGGTDRLATPAVWAAWAVWAVLAVITVTTVALIRTDPHGPVEGTAATATWCALVAQIVVLVGYGRPRDAHRREADPGAAPALGDVHPALTELVARDSQAAARLRVSRRRTRRGRNRGRPRGPRHPAVASQAISSPAIASQASPNGRSPAGKA
ncbi:hypothetical protein [Streptomyces sp. AB3(2024)]|uniref:hypothetical protein n=1 Tax=Streptomyces sp. AB3(2024) TaxID=3317321 RepID=UPI0035A34C5F